MGDTGYTEESLSKKYHPQAERSVREYLILQKLIEQGGIIATDEMLEQAYKEMAKRTNQPVDAIKQLHEKYKETYEVFKQRTLEEQAIKSIIKKSTIETVEADKVEAQEPEAGASEAETKPEPREQGDR